MWIGNILRFLIGNIPTKLNLKNRDIQLEIQNPLIYGIIKHFYRSVNLIVSSVIYAELLNT